MKPFFTNKKIIIRDLLHLVFPEECLVCENELTASDQHLCSICRAELIRTNFELFEEETPMDKLFWGRTKVEFTYAHLFFKKGSSSQKILFSLKYRNNPELGKFFGQEIGKAINEVLNKLQVDAIIPVPLHPRKKFIRGYNQSEALAKGIAENTGIPVREDLVKRNTFTSSQTGKSRFERWENVTSKFSVGRQIKNLKHVLLIDDVITTGSTIESIIEIIKQEHPEIQISVVTLAIA